MKWPFPECVDRSHDALSGEASPEQAPPREVLFEMGMIVASYLAVALSVSLTLRAFGLF
jgi:hypothetical protein